MARDRDKVEQRCRAAGLDDYAIGNLITLVEEQRTATGHLPTDKTLVVERFRDELGDWRLVLHSPYGLPVHAGWALAIGARLRERFGVDAAPTASDDGIIVRLPDTTDEPPGADLFVFEQTEIDDIVTEQVGGSALFASRFRECAARALLLPRRDPGKRAPLWQQRQRSAQLLEVARKYPTFPILLETVRECLQDVYDLPALRDLFGRLARRQIRLVEVETPTPSPFANALLFDYVGTFMYEGDSPLAERRAAALSLDSTLLAELLGRVELRDLLDAGVIETTERELQRLPDGSPRPRRRGRGRSVADARTVHRGRDRRTHGRSRAAVPHRPRDRPPRADRHVRRDDLVDRGGGCEPDARCARRAAAGRDPDGVRGGGRRPARRPRRPLRPHPRPVLDRTGRRPFRDRAARSPNRYCAGSRSKSGWWKASSGPARRAPSGVTPAYCVDCGAGRSRRRAPRSNRSHPPRWAGSCPAGSTSAAVCAASTASRR